MEKIIVKIRIRNSINNQLVSIWRERLGCKKVNPGHDFFELGGDSGLVTQLLATLKNRHNRVFQAKDVFKISAPKE